MTACELCLWVYLLGCLLRICDVMISAADAADGLRDCSDSWLALC